MQKSLVSKEYRQFLAFLKKARQDVKLTQERLAKKLKTTQSFVSKAERGERRLDVIELRLWARALGFDFVDFVSGFEVYLKQNHKTKPKASKTSSNDVKLNRIVKDTAG